MALFSTESLIQMLIPLSAGLGVYVAIRVDLAVLHLKNAQLKSDLERTDKTVSHVSNKLDRFIEARHN